MYLNGGVELELGTPLFLVKGYREGSSAEAFSLHFGERESPGHCVVPLNVHFDRREEDIIRRYRLPCYAIRCFSPGTLRNDLNFIVERVIKPWLDDCLLPRGSSGESCHPHCATLSRNPPRLPTRVIDVGTDYIDPYLYIPALDTPSNDRTSSGHYVILSYCWGSGDANSAAKTTSRNLGERRKVLDLEILPETIRDAVILTRAMGQRYLWVDAICIVQAEHDHDNQDFDQEAPRMGSYYENAICTIAAVSAASSSDGLFVGREAQRFRTKTQLLGTGTVPITRCKHAYLSASRPSWGNGIASSSWDRRGWTLQERKLSPRTLYWTRTALYWECNSLRASEYDPSGRICDPWFDTEKTLYDSWYAETKSSLKDVLGRSVHRYECPAHTASWLREFFSVWAKVGLSRAWTGFVQDYTKRNFTFNKDKLVAIQGMVHRIYDQMVLMAQSEVNFEVPHYIAGHWANSNGLETSLSWRAQNLHSYDGKAVECTDSSFPSWSWASASFGNITWSSTLTADFELLTHWKTRAWVASVGEAIVRPSKKSILPIRGYIGTLPSSSNVEETSNFYNRSRLGWSDGLRRPPADYDDHQNDYIFQTWSPRNMKRLISSNNQYASFVWFDSPQGESTCLRGLQYFVLTVSPMRTCDVVGALALERISLRPGENTYKRIGYCEIRDIRAGHNWWSSLPYYEIFLT
ncbi:heterokaryon incompatibility protein-domain-containing protein [Hypoxylon sp. FL1857]|nr:heterokaryon incompatibility protein-domain-containing protein [Hypoxylon sp. FL1857]